MTLRPAEHLGVEIDERTSAVYIAALPDGPIVVLEGTAALIWITAGEHPRERVADEVARRTGEAAAVVADAVDAFLADLAARGLLVEA